MQNKKNKGIGKKPRDKFGDSFVPYGRNFLFTIGIDEYEHCDPLYNAVKDTEDFSRVLFSKYNFEAANHFYLKNKEATKDNIINTFREIKDSVKPTDNLIIYYSGHGVQDEDFDENYWILADNRKGMVGDYLPFKSVMTFLKGIKTHHILLIIDACSAGAFLVHNNKKVNNPLYKYASRNVIVSGLLEDASDGIPGENSPFATALIEKLEEGEENISAKDLAHYITYQTLLATDSRQVPVYSQLPIKGLWKGAFVFYLKNKSEDTFWYGLFDKPTVIGFDSYLERYPQGKYIEDAKWEIAEIEKTSGAYFDYLKEYPNGKYKSEANVKMADLEEEELWKRATKRNTILAYHRYLQNSEKGKYEIEASNRINKIRNGETELEDEKREPIPPLQHTKDPLIIPSRSNQSIFRDPRDGKIYQTIKLKDGKEWMARNLNFDTGKDCSFYDNNFRNGVSYGKLYTWEGAKEACPPGWRLPTLEEWQNLIYEYGGYSGNGSSDGKNAYRSLTIGGSSGFDAKFGGCLNNNNLFYGQRGYGFYWCSDGGNASAWWALFSYPQKNILLHQGSYKNRRFSCRCIRG